MMIRILTAAACLLATSLSCHAGGLNLKHIPADAKWLVHIDCARLNDTGFAESLQSQKSGLAKMFQNWAMKGSGINLPQELESLTMFSSDYRPYTGSVIVEADYDAKKIAALVSKQKHYAASQFGNHKLHTFTLKEQPKSSPSGDMEMTVVMVDSGTLLMASSKQNARNILRLLAGEVPSLDSSPSKLAPRNATSAWMVGAAIDLGDLKRHPVAMPVLSQHERIHWTFGETEDGQWYERADLVASENQVAKEMETVLHGIIAYETLYADGIETMQKLLDNTTVRRNGNVAGFDWQADAEIAVAAINGKLDRAMTWKDLFMDRNASLQR